MNIRQTLLSASLALVRPALRPAVRPRRKRPPRLLQCNRHPLPQPPAQRMTSTWACFHPVVANNGMVATEQELASRIGLDILKAGGNAVDAAVGIGFALAVALPNAGNLGGGGFMMVHDAKTGKSVALDFREVAPLKATPQHVPWTTRAMSSMASRFLHPLRRGVPGTVAGMEHALKKWGTMPLDKVIAPSIALAEKGFPVSETPAKILRQEQRTWASGPPPPRSSGRTARPLKRGDLLVQRPGPIDAPDCAAGAKAFYEGAIAQKIAAEMAPRRCRDAARPARIQGGRARARARAPTVATKW